MRNRVPVEDNKSRLLAPRLLASLGVGELVESIDLSL